MSNHLLSFIIIIIIIIIIIGVKGDWDFRISDLVKILMELIFNPCGEFRWSLEGPVSQIHSPHLLVGAPVIFSVLLRFVQMLKREWGAESNGKLPHIFIASKTAALFPEFAVEDLPLAELQPWFLRLQWRTCPCAEHSDNDDSNCNPLVLSLSVYFKEYLSWDREYLFFF